MQTLAISRKLAAAKTGENTRKPLPWVATSCDRAWMVSPCGPGGTPRTAWKCGRSSIRACLTAPLGRPLLRGGGEVRVDLGKCRDSATPARSISRSGGGRRFESVAPAFHTQKTCKLASSVAHQGANDRRSLFHPAYIPHGNRRGKPTIAADSRDPDYRSIGRSFSDVANHVPTRGPSTGLRPGGPRASGYPRGGRVRSPARR